MSGSKGDGTVAVGYKKVTRYNLQNPSNRPENFMALPEQTKKGFRGNPKSPLLFADSRRQTVICFLSVAFAMFFSPEISLSGGKGPLCPDAHPSMPGSSGGRECRTPRGRPVLLSGNGTCPGGTRGCAAASCGARGCTPRSFRDGGSAFAYRGSRPPCPARVLARQVFPSFVSWNSPQTDFFPFRRSATFLPL
jgi:hypothetical protein